MQARQVVGFWVVLIILAARPCCAGGLQDTQTEASRPQIRGSVVDPVNLQPIADAEVSLVMMPDNGVLSAVTSPAAAMTETTDATGGFSFQMQNVGRYRVEAQKRGYVSLVGPLSKDARSGENVVLTSKNPVRELRLFLAVPAELMGRVVDDATDQPIPNLRVRVLRVAYDRGRANLFYTASPSTEKDGLFRATMLPPGDYVLETAPRVTWSMERLAKTFAAGDAEQVDEDYENSFWPGSSEDASKSSPLRVLGGGSLDTGRLRLRKVPYYRVRVNFSWPDCRDGQTASIDVWSGNTVNTLGEVPCGTQQLLARGFLPGEYRLVAWSKGTVREALRAGSAALVVTNRPTEVSLVMSRGLEVQGSIVAAEGARLPNLSKLSVVLNPVQNIRFITDKPYVPDSKGNFSIVNMEAAQYRLGLFGLDTGYYLKEVQYNHNPVTGRVLSINKYASEQVLEIVIDDKPAAVTGSVKDGSRPIGQAYIALVRLPVSETDIFASTVFKTADENGRFRFGDLGPGEYRLLALAPHYSNKVDEPNVLAGLLSKANSVTLNRGSVQDFTLEPITP